MFKLSLVKLLTCGVFRSYSFRILIREMVEFDMLKSKFPHEPALYSMNGNACIWSI